MKKSDRISFGMPYGISKAKLLELIGDAHIMPSQAKKLLDQWTRLYPEKEPSLPELRCKNCDQAISLVPKGFVADYFTCGRCGYENYIGKGALNSDTHPYW